MNKEDVEKLQECYNHVSQRLIDAEEILERNMKLISLVSIDRDMFSGWLEEKLADMFDKSIDEYAEYKSKYMKEI